MMNDSFARHIQEDRRLVILRVLAVSASYQVNEFTLAAVLEDQGHSISSDQLRTELAWLNEQGLIKSSSVAGVVIATLAQRGLDVSQGKAVVPGVKRPKPD